MQSQPSDGGPPPTWSLDGVRRVLYNLPAVTQAEKVYLVEGEKDADNLTKIGLTATTSPGGANNWRPEYADYLSGKKVVIIPDQDKAGYEYAKAAATSLQGKADVSCILLPDGVKDISDWLKLRDFAELHEEDIKALNAEPMKFENKSSRYLFKWAGFTVEISKIKVTRDTTICQLVVIPDNGVIFRTKFNLESPRVRSETAKELTKRYKDCEWALILEDITNKTLDEFEKGEPVIEIHTSDEVPELKYLIDPIIPLGKPSVFFGDPGAGKSQLAAVFVILTSFNTWDDNPLRLAGPDKIMRGLVLDWEADEDDWRRQLKWFTDIFGLGYAEMYYRRCSLSLAHDLEAIRAHIEAVRADYIIIDSVSLAAGGDLNHMDVATNYFRALRQLNMTTISLAHTSKNREDKNKTILGSVLFEAGARSVWEVRGQEDDNLLDIALFHRKSNLARKHTPLGYRITYQPDPDNPRQTIPETMTWLNPNSVEEFVERMKTTDRILHYLTGIKASEEIIAEQLGLTLNNIKVALSRLKKKNLVVKVGDLWMKLQQPG